MSFFNNILKKIPFLNQGEKKSNSDRPNIEDILAESEIKSSGERIQLRKCDLEQLEEELIKSDIGLSLALDFRDQIQKELQSNEVYRDELQAKLKKFLMAAFDKFNSKNPFKFELDNEGLTILMILGVNGVGKTTSIAKLAHKYVQAGKKVLIAAGDTFRAAAEDQLRTWAERTGADLIEMPHGSKSSAVTYKAIEKAKQENYDLVLVDTAGRLHNKKNLMEELAKIKEVIKKNLQGSRFRLETSLVLDSSMGQNSLTQAEAFNEMCNLDSIILTKFDGSAKAGVIFSIAHKLKIPVKFLGTGEAMTDLEEFSLENFTSKYF